MMPMEQFIFLLFFCHSRYDLQRTILNIGGQVKGVLSSLVLLKGTPVYFTERVVFLSCLGQKYKFENIRFILRLILKVQGKFFSCHLNAVCDVTRSHFVILK